MAKVIAYIRCSKTAEKARIRFRLTDINKLDITHTSEIEISPYHFDKKSEGYLSKANVPEKVKIELEMQVLARKELLLDLYEGASKNEILTSKWFNQKVAERISNNTLSDNFTKNQPLEIQTSIEKPKEEKEEPLLIDSFIDFIDIYKISEVRKSNYRVILRTLQRYELYACLGKRKKRILLKDINTDQLTKIEDFFKNENELAKTYPDLYKHIPEKRLPKKRGNNTISDIMTKLHTFFMWCYKEELIKSNPFRNFKINPCVYGSPVYITLDELNKIYITDLSFRPALAIQRDIFVFHSLVGCRVSDLMRLSYQNVIDDTITYIANKTKHLRSNAIIVPLNDTSRAIIDKYKGGDKLLPFISEQKYNKAIKEIFKLSGITRKVIILNSLSGKEELVGINTIASSHMCRRNMVGNLYQKVQDTAIISAMTGHSPHSRAFARYRVIENDIKKSAIDHLKLSNR